MNLPEQLVVIINSLDANPPYAVVKAQLLKLSEQLDACADTLAQNLKLVAENAALRAENEKLKNPPSSGANWGPKDPPPNMTTD